MTATRLPARETRIAEPPVNDMRLVVGAVCDAFGTLGATRVALFGACSGALIAFEVARELRRRDASAPAVLLVADQVAPSVARDESRPESDVWRRVRAMGTTPSKILENEEVRLLLQPALEADFVLVDTYTYATAPPLPCPVVSFVAEEAYAAAAHDFDAWARETSREFALHRLPGARVLAGTQWRRLGSLVGTVARRFLA